MYNNGVEAAAGHSPSTAVVDGCLLRLIKPKEVNHIWALPEDKPEGGGYVDTLNYFASLIQIAEAIIKIAQYLYQKLNKKK